MWRTLRRHGISLRRRRSWCLSTDPAFAQKAADIVGLYLDPPENAMVLCVDEKPGIQALERSQSWLRLPDGRSLTGFAYEYRRHGTTTLFAALEVASGLIQTGHEAAFLAASADRPLARIGTPADVARGVLYLVSDAAEWVTGTTLVVDGGGLA